MEATVSHVSAFRHPLGRFALMLLVVPKPWAAPVQQDQGVVEACTKEAVVLVLTSRVVVGDTMEEQEVKAMVAVAAAVQATRRVRFFVIYKAFMLAMEI